MSTTGRVWRLDKILRCSQDDKREGDSYRSPGQQDAALDRFFATHDQYEWTGVTFDATVGNHSGKTMERDEVEAVIQRVRSGQSDGAAVMSLDRFSRAPVLEVLSTYKQVEDAGGRVVAADLVFPDPTSPEARFMVTGMLNMHRYQWEKIAQRYELSRKDAIADGKCIAQPVLGYRYRDPTKKERGRGIADSRLVVDEPMRRIALELFERKADGATWLELARWLDTVAPKPSGRKWARSSVLSLIESRQYLGEVSSGPYVKTKAHEALIPEPLWRRAQRPPGDRTPRGDYLLTGRVRCAGCGRRMQAGKPRHLGGRRTFECKTPECDSRSSIMVDLLDTEVLDRLWEHVGEMHAVLVDDAEMQAAQARISELAEKVAWRYSLDPPRTQAGRDAHQTAIRDDEAALAEAEDHYDSLRKRHGTDPAATIGLREDFERMSLSDQREIVREGIDAVLVRRATRSGPASRGTPHPIRDRVLVLFRGEAPVELTRPGGTNGIIAWTWAGFDAPRSLVAAS